MRIYLRTTPNDVIVPFDYQQKIVGTIHKWLGNNEIHDKIFLYSFSWLLGGNMIMDKGYNFSKGATLFISFYENKYLKVLIDTILSDPEMFCGLSVKRLRSNGSRRLRKNLLFSGSLPRFLLNG